MGDSNLADQFTAEEVELLICGSKVTLSYLDNHSSTYVNNIIIGMGF